MGKAGYVLIARGMLDHPRFKPRGAFSDAEAWFWLINAASYKPRQVSVFVGRQRKFVELERGQMCHSIRFLALAWRWGVNRVQKFLKSLQNDGSIDTQTSDGQLVITLCNYRVWQSPTESETDETDTQTNTQTDTKSDTGTNTQTDTRTDTKKNTLKERKEDIGRSKAKPDDGFAEWYAVYPKKMKPLDAEKAYRQTIAAGRIERADLLARTIIFAGQCAKRTKDERQFIPYPASWLRAGGFLDETVVPKATAQPVTRRRPEDFTPSHWHNVFEVSKKEGKWLEDAWGPPPTSPQCRAPPDILAKHGYGPISEP